ncbi:hypothetical protein ACPCSC_30755 [Streptomyces lavendulocolor]|uniref:hypothetical protein n=1 Tax=Streptomyces lavendulocolor TaxID=67316 RepID=UPI003C2AF5FF
MTSATPSPTIPPCVRLDSDEPPAADLLVLLALRELGRRNLPSSDVVYSFGRRKSG